MGAPIAINGNFNIPQPSGMKEEIIQRVVNRVSIKGVQHRYWEAQKQQATLTWTAINQGQYNQLISYFLNRGSPVSYTNPNSGFGFTGHATNATDEYMKGSSYLRNFSVTIIQI